jgi:hypothetical protein
MDLQYVLEHQSKKPYQVRVYCPVRKTWVWRGMNARRRDVAEREARTVVASVLLESAGLAREQAARAHKLADELAATAIKLGSEGG